MMDFRIQPKDDADRAYAEGMEARENGVPVDANPYKVGGECNEHWEMGWYDQDAYMDEDDGDAS